jgi:hypothetical protein
MGRRAAPPRAGEHVVPFMIASLGLLATDYDGTLIDQPEPSPAEMMAFRQRLRELRRLCGTRWAVVTGRHLPFIPELRSRLLLHGLLPDFLVMEDACIFQRRGMRYWPFWWWNFGIGRRRRAQLARQRKRVRTLVAEIRALYPDALDLSAGRALDFWFQFGSAADAREVEQRLLTTFADGGDFFVFRWEDEVCLAPTAGTKGEAVRRLATECGLEPEQILAIGDGQNDLSMLDGRAARHVACVANATPEVKRAVERAGGFVAREPALAGVLEALAHVGPGADAGGRVP